MTSSLCELQLVRYPDPCARYGNVLVLENDFLFCFILFQVVVQFLPPVVVLLISLDDGANNRTALDANRAVDIASVLFFSNKAAAVDFVIKLNNLLAGT